MILIIEGDQSIAAWKFVLTLQGSGPDVFLQERTNPDIDHFCDN